MPRADYKKLAFVIAGCIAFMYFHAIGWKAEFPDFTIFLNPWLDALRAHGPAIIGTDFANYHPPYLYIIWFFSLFIPDNLSVIKAVSALGDILLALSVYGVVRQVMPHGNVKYVAAYAVTLLPTVMINSAFWGQCDAFYTAFLLFALMYALKGNGAGVWALVGAAVAFKTQGIFLIPFALFVTLAQKHAPTVIAYAALVLIGLLGAPLLFGVQISQLVTYYVTDLSPMWGMEMLSWWCANVMAWLPDSQYYLWHYVGIGAYVLILVGFAVYGWRVRSGKVTSRQLIVVATLSAMLSTFVLPQMHERYYFPAEVLLFVLAVLAPRWAVAAGIMQFVTITAMGILFAGHVSPDRLPFKVLSLLVFGIIIALFIRVHKARGIINHTSEGKE